MCLHCDTDGKGGCQRDLCVVYVIMEDWWCALGGTRCIDRDGSGRGGVHSWISVCVPLLVGCRLWFSCPWNRLEGWGKGCFVSLWWLGSHCPHNVRGCVLGKHVYSSWWDGLTMRQV